MSLIKNLFLKNPIIKKERDKQFEQLYKGLSFADNPDPLFMFNSLGDILQVNNAAIGRFGKRGSLLDYIQKKEHEKCAYLLHAFCLKGITCHDYFQFEQIEGKPVKLLVSIYPIKKENEVIGGYALTKSVNTSGLVEVKSLNQNLEEIFNEIDAVVWSFDYQLNKIKYLSSSTEKLLGIPNETLIQRPLLWETYIQHEDVLMLKKSYKNVLAGNAMTHEVRVLFPDSTVKWVQVKVTPTLSEDGSISSIIGYMFDITEKKKLENMIIKKDQKYLALFANHTDPIFTLNLEGVVLEVNPAGERMLNFTENEKIGAHFLSFVAPEHKEKSTEYFQEVLKGKTQNFNMNFTCNLKGKFQLNVTLIPIFVKGEVSGVHSILKDLSDLEESEAKYRGLVENSLAGVFMIQHGKYVFANKKLHDIVMAENKSLLNQPILQHVHEEDRELIENNVNRLITNELNYVHFQTRSKRKDGKIVHLEIYASFLNYRGAPAIIGTAIDVTERSEMEILLEQKEKIVDKQNKWFESIIKNTNDIVTIINEKGEITYTSPAFNQILGFEAKERIGMPIFDYIHPEQLDTVLENFSLLSEERINDLKMECLLEHKDGSWHHFAVRATNYMKDPIINGIIVNCYDITEKKTVAKELERVSNFDQLTNLPNRSYFQQYLKETLMETTEHQTFAIFYIDIDRFKFINDSLGPLIGDELIKNISIRLNERTDSDSFLGHLRSDEFIILQKNIKSAELSSIAENILQAFENPFIIEDYEFYVTASIGISVYPESGKTVEELLKNADIAMSHAKKLEANKYVTYSSELDVESFKKFMITSDLRKAIERDELHLHFQPLIDCSSNKVVAAEALVRWNHPVWGELPPTEFIPTAEQNGLISFLGNWVLRNACKQLKAWQKANLQPISISVNVSPIQFSQYNFVHNVFQTLEDFNLDPKFLVLEITENIFADGSDTVVNKLKELRKKGITIALDDFGTGYSSLNYLQRFKADYLKIDKTFLQGIEKNQNEELLASIIELAKNINLSVVVEGIETEEQYKKIQSMKCDIGQGFLFSPAVSSEQFQRILECGLSSQLPTRSDPKKKRRFYRITFDFPLAGSFTIDSVRGKKVHVGNTPILVKDVSAGGLNFLSDIKLPPKTDLLIKVSAKMGDYSLEQIARVVWSSEQEDQLYEYGIEFIASEQEQEVLLKRMNIIQAQLRKRNGSIMKQLITEDPKDYFHYL
ncbi:diguanylate cyclase (GGDEF)-like protein/PAS domain S-box-containing protein [Salirhabdus euzebyi]|uniref:Diguanylate cyclase (GGDEF)-like protein/PAS domain S-box-containing protein n=1 Tax=Salirhabdus euzebyi TaxID=394506 RepID=A0A841Q404_9BACI|nr:EAL domain-containing protein [Salirhabdus euzebyi]MBB6453093.1 diguanylate cyclase (GGDEF)-like protein/PAS domain S-box-containing protein [Salirhabdus euzebyi]